MKPFTPELTNIYNPTDIEYVLDTLGEIPTCKNTKDRHKNYYNIPCSFDVETSSFYDKNEKRACLVCWSFCIYDVVIFGRTWGEFETMLQTIKERLKLSEELRLLIYCHNLQYEFQWIRKHFEWAKVFSLDVRKPVYAITTDGFEFRCSYILSGYNLATVGKNLTKYKVQKQEGAWNYDLLRGTNTPITDEEKKYSCYDVLVVCAYIMERIEADGTISTIPLTKTGYVRNAVRKECFEEEGNPQHNCYQRLYYMDMMKYLTIEPEELILLQASFQGGFTHSNPTMTNKVIYNVDSDDFTSSYPYVAVAEDEFPMSKGNLYKVKDYNDLKKQNSLYATVFEVYFENIESKTNYEYYISSAHCPLLTKPTIANGRIVKAAELMTTITGIDFQIIETLYKWEKIKIGKMVRYKKGYLPKEIVHSILKFYKAKTTLKGVKGKEVEYLAGKENVNSIYGMMAMNPIRTQFDYVGEEWQDPSIPEFKETLEKYNNNKGRFLTFAWATFLTALARRNLFTGIVELKHDYIYADTDSLKYINREKHVEYFENYNKFCLEKLDRAMKFHGFSSDLYRPKTVEGIEKPLGVWDRETKEKKYTRFKTLGAKRYIYEDDGELHITVAGLSKQIAVKYLEESGDPFGVFEDGLYIPPEYTGKKIHTYIDSEQSGSFTDYMGNTNYYHEFSCIHLAPCEFHLGLQGFLNFLLELNELREV